MTTTTLPTTTSHPTPVPITLTSHILKTYAGQKDQNDLAILHASIAQACKCIAAAIRTAPLNNFIGLAGGKNSMGEEQKKLDVIANDHFVGALVASQKVCGMVSEEEADLIPISEENVNGNFVVAFDPLDGSSNIDVAVPVGSIWAIYRKQSSGKLANLSDCLQVGSNMVCAGYAMYGSCTQIIIATTRRVDGFTLDPVSGEFIMTHPEMKVPKKGNIYSVNEGNAASWEEWTRKYVAMKKEGKPASLRYVGSMVADVHRTLLVGGLFMYPSDKANKNGKLRLLYEVNPMSFIMTRAGGAAETGRGKALDIVPDNIHQRVPIYLGSTDNVAEIINLMNSTQ